MHTGQEPVQVEWILFREQEWLGETLTGERCCWMSTQQFRHPLFLPAQSSPQSRGSHWLAFPSSFTVSHGHVTGSSQWNPRYDLLGAVLELVKEVCWARGFLACFIVSCCSHTQALGNAAAIFSQSRKKRYSEPLHFTECNSVAEFFCANYIQKRKRNLYLSHIWTRCCYLNYFL